MKTVLALTATLTAAALTASLAPAYAADTVRIRPPALERGEETRVPHLEHHAGKPRDETIVDGDTRIDIRAKNAWLMGRSLDGYVYATWGNGTTTRSSGSTLRAMPPCSARVAPR